MAKVVKRTFSLTEEQAAFIDRKVESGEFASASEVLRTGLRTMEERDRMLEHWLRSEVVPALKRNEADPSRLLSEDDVSKALEEHHERRVRERHETSKARVRA